MTILCIGQILKVVCGTNLKVDSVSVTVLQYALYIYVFLESNAFKSFII